MMITCDDVPEHEFERAEVRGTYSILHLSRLESVRLTPTTNNGREPSEKLGSAFKYLDDDNPYIRDPSECIPTC
jgi:hypothetical protein